MMLAILLFGLINVAAQETATPQTAFRCTQPVTERESLLREAIDNRYTVRRVEFVGNESTRDNVLRRRVFLQEGDIFTRRNLLRSLANVSKLKIIYPVKISDVVVQLDRSDKLVDFIFCFRERHDRQSKRAS